MSNSDLKRLILTIIVVVSGLFGFWYYRTNTEDYLANQEDFSVPPEPLAVADAPATGSSSAEMTISTDSFAPVTEVEPEKPVPPAVDYDQIFETKQKVLKETFQNNIKLHLSLPENMNFHEMDLDENVVGLFGREQASSKKFAVMATTARPTIDEVVKYLNETRKANPILHDREFVITGKTLTFSPPPNSGLGTVTVIPAGENVYAAFVQRKDNKGSYLFMMEAPASYFRNNDDGFEQLLNSVKIDN